MTRPIVRDFCEYVVEERWHTPVHRCYFRGPFSYEGKKYCGTHLKKVRKWGRVEGDGSKEAMTKKPGVGYSLRVIEVEVPDDHDIGHEEIEWLEHIIERAAKRGSGLEDAECAVLHQAEKKAEIEGAKRAQQFIRELSGAAFAAGKDSEAGVLRGVAEKLTPLLVSLEKERADHEELFLTSYHREVEKRRATGEAAE